MGVRSVRRRVSTVDLATDLIAIPSHNTDRTDESAAGDAIEAWLREHSSATVRRDDAPRGGNVIARAGPAGDPELALVGHHDVVEPAEGHLSEDGFAVDRRDGRLYGRGSADMKGSLAAAMVAFVRIAERADEPIAFASFVGEEAGGVGCRWAIDEGFAPERAIVLEGSTGYVDEGSTGEEDRTADGETAITDVAVAHKGRRALDVEASGTAAHASVGADGDNAIYRAHDAIDSLRAIDPPTRTIADQTVEGSVAVTEIEGGSSWNVIPEACSVTVDERTIPGDRIDTDAIDGPGVDVWVEQDLPPMVCDDDAFVAVAIDAAREAVVDASAAREPRRIVKPHATDAGWLSDRAGTDCLVIGAAEPGEAHTDDESVSIDAIERCRRIDEWIAREIVT
ncbi:MAG: M20 family metallopeptidase [Halococcoides sp.]